MQSLHLIYNFAVYPYSFHSKDFIPSVILSISWETKLLLHRLFPIIFCHNNLSNNQIYIYFFSIKLMKNSNGDKVLTMKNKISKWLHFKLKRHFATILILYIFEEGNVQFTWFYKYKLSIPICKKPSMKNILLVVIILFHSLKFGFYTFWFMFTSFLTSVVIFSS